MPPVPERRPSSLLSARGDRTHSSASSFLLCPAHALLLSPSSSVPHTGDWREAPEAQLLGPTSPQRSQQVQTTVGRNGLRLGVCVWGGSIHPHGQAGTCGAGRTHPLAQDAVRGLLGPRAGPSSGFPKPAYKQHLPPWHFSLICLCSRTSFFRSADPRWTFSNRPRTANRGSVFTMTALSLFCFTLTVPWTSVYNGLSAAAYVFLWHTSLDLQALGNSDRF